ncbi:MAG: tetratricopeptide repeat protein [Desulfomonile tiedjei]|nr:tetratricopeptide repeat protein [Desulfomonile tiedjei]
MTRNNWSLLLVVLPMFILVALALHWNSFTAPMYYDSVGELESKEHIYASGLLKVIQLYPQRPVPFLSFYLNYMIWGMNPFYFRIINAVILALTALVAAGVFILMIDIAVPANSASWRQRQAVGIFLGLVFLAHPIQTYFVAYIWQRVGLLCCFFYISSLGMYLATRTGRFPHTVAGYIFCLVLFCLALMSKEKAATLPVVLTLAEIAFFRNGWKNLLRRIGVFIVLLIPLLVILSFLVRPHGEIAGSPGILATIGKHYAYSNLSLSQVVLSQCRVLFSYLEMIIAPVSSNVRFTTAHVIFSSPLESLEIAVSVLGVCAIFAASILLIKKRPLSGFGLLFFLVNLIPEAISVPQYLFFAHRANLPMFGLLLVLGDVVLVILARARSLASRKWYLSAPVAASLAALVILAISAVTISKARLWQDPVAFWTEIVDGLPLNHEKLEKRVIVDALGNLGTSLQRQAKVSEAISILRRAAGIDPLYARTHLALGVAHSQLGEMSEAESALKRAVETDPSSAAARFGLAELYLTQDKVSEAWPHMQKVADLAPYDPKGFNGMGTVLLRQGNASEAVAFFRKAIEIAPGFHEAQYNLGEALANLGRDGEAVKHLRRSVDLKPSNWRAHNSLGLVLTKTGNTREATTHFREALALKPDDWGVHNNLGALLAKSGNLEQAAVHFQEAVRINPDDISARKNLERVRRLIGTLR